MPHFILYHTLGCHLCEDAELIIEPLSNALSMDYQRKDIADDDRLIDLYGIRIPVLCHLASQSTLDWPFDTYTAKAFMLSFKAS